MAELDAQIVIPAEDKEPLYQKIAPKVAELAQLGMNSTQIAKALGGDPKTVRKAISL